MNARIVNFQGLSSHADRDHLLAWIQHFSPAPQQVFVVHGDSEVTDLFARDLNEASPPTPYEEVTTCPPIPRWPRACWPRKVSGGAAAGSPAFVRLQDVPPAGSPHQPQPGPPQQGSGPSDQLRQVMESWET